jgi:hypothetical protein
MRLLGFLRKAASTLLNGLASAQKHKRPLLSILWLRQVKLLNGARTNGAAPPSLKLQSIGPMPGGRSDRLNAGTAEEFELVDLHAEKAVRAVAHAVAAADRVHIRARAGLEVTRVRRIRKRRPQHLQLVLEGGGQHIFLAVLFLDEEAVRKSHVAEIDLGNSLVGGIVGVSGFFEGHQRDAVADDWHALAP